MHGPGLFLIILRKGLGLFFERAIHKSARCPNAQTSQKNSDFPQAWDSSHPEAIPKESRRNRHKKKRPNKESLETYKEVGMTGLEPATTGPPDRHSKPTELHPVFCLAGAKVLRFLKPAKLFGLFLPFRPKNSTFAGE